MSYQVLARKWRPTKFSEVIGQQHVVQALTNAMQTGRLHHAYLFTGTRGVGKTTLGRILAKSLNCEQGQAAEPCGQCSSCEEIDQGRFVDLIEIDAASRTKVEDTREILDNVQYRPTRGRYKVYIIDEVHMLSRHSFNALLKTLEEPPSHVKFLLATTDPQKLPITILSRCLQFNLRAMTLEQIKGQLQHILQQENVAAESFALEQLARAAKGSMRDALSLTDQAIAHGQGELTAQQVTAMLGLLDRDYENALFKALLAGDAQQLMHTITEVASFAPDYDKLMASLQSLLHRASLTLFAPASVTSVEGEAGLLKAIASHWSAEQIQLAYQILVQGRRDLAFAPDPKSGLEMALLRVLMFRPMHLTDLPTASSAPATAVVAAPVATVAHAEVASTAEASSSTAEPESESESESETELNAEQAVLLSMAESQGFQPTDVTRSEPPVALMPEPSLPEPLAPEASPSEPSLPEASLPEPSLTVEPVAAKSPSAESNAAVMDSAPAELAPSANPEPELAAPPVAHDACSEPASSSASAPSSDAGLSDGLATMLEARNLLRSQIKKLAGQSSDSQPATATAKATPEVKPQPQPVTPIATEQPKLISARVEESQTAALIEPVLASSPPPAQASEPYSPQPLPQAAAADLPPWHDEQSVDLSEYDNLPPQAYSAEEPDGYHASAAFSEEPPLAAEPALPAASQQPPLPSAAVDVSQPYVETKAWWEQLIDTLGFDALKRQLALDCVLVANAEGYDLQVPAKAKHLASPSNLAELIERIKGYVGLTTHIEIVQQTQIVEETPRQAQGRRSEEKLQHAIASIYHDPVIKELQQTFDAMIDQDTITPT